LSDLKTKSLNAFKWNVLSQVLNQLVILGVNIYLVRLLSPYEFGLIGVPFVVYSFFRMVQDFGYADVLIKEKIVDNKLSSSIYWFIIFGGIIASILCYLIAPLIGYWTQNIITSEITKWFALLIFAGSFSIGLEAMMRKELNFKTSFYIEFFSSLVSGLVSIYLAMHGWSWKALVFKFLSHTFLQLILNLIFTKWRPQFHFNNKALKPHFSFASINISEQVLNFIVRNIDNVLIVRFIGTYALGIYDRSYRLLMFPLQQVSGSFSKVMFPAFSTIQNEKERVGDNFLKIVGLISLVTFPMMMGLFVLCEEFVVVVFGRQWIEMVPVLKMFCVISIFQSISTVSGSIFAATDNMKALIKYSLIAKPISISVIFLAVFIHRDIYFVTLYIAITSLIMMFPLWSILANCIGIKAIDIWAKILPQLLATLVMMLIVYLTKVVLVDYNLAAILLVGILAGIIGYVMVLIVTKNENLKEAASLIKTLKSQTKD
jgi:O-antigen/teichoic acid export membrane protein